MLKYIKRSLEPLILKSIKNFPALVITGARQTGKSTLIKQLFPDAAYLSFDSLSLRNYAKSDPVGFLSEYSGVLILDEIQEVPELLSYIKIEIDKNRQPGRFIITGSQQFSLMEGVQESLAGRAAILELSTFSFIEIQSKIKKLKWQELAYRGCYPEIWTNKGIDIELWYSSYVKTFIDRDISKHLKEQNLYNYGRFIELLAVRTAQELNITSLSKELGLDQKTIQTWLSFLIRSQIVFLLPPFYKNLGKRIIKKPKLYFYDTGLVASLTRHRNAGLIKNGPMSGAFYENLIISELMKQNMAKAKQKNFFYFRENSGLEIDLIIDDPLNPLAIEIKTTMTPSLADVNNLIKFRELVDTQFRTHLICPSLEKLSFKGVKVLNHDEVFSVNILKAS